MNRIEARLQSVLQNGCRYIDVWGKGVAAEEKRDYRLLSLGADQTGLQLSSCNVMERYLAYGFAGCVPLWTRCKHIFAHNAFYYIASGSGFQAGSFVLSGKVCNYLSKELVP